MNMNLRASVAVASRYGFFRSSYLIRQKAQNSDNTVVVDLFPKSAFEFVIFEVTGKKSSGRLARSAKLQFWL